MTKTARLEKTDMSHSPNSKSATELAIIILAAGKGTRMKSATPKVLHKIAGLPMISHIVKTAESLKPKKIVTVISEGMDDVAAAVAPHQTAIQKQQKGTADAMKSALSILGDFAGEILILYGDVPLVSKSTLEGLLTHHRKGKFGATVLAMAAPDPTLDAAIEEAVPAPVLSAALFARFSSRGASEMADRLLSAMRYEFGGHRERPRE